MTRPSRFKPYFYFAAGWLVPGLGHFLQRKRAKAAVFFAGVAAMVGLGLLMRGGFAPWPSLEPLAALSFLGGIGSGVFYAAGQLAGAGVGNLWAYTYQYGAAYIAAAGFMNLLVALNAFTTARAREAGRV
jgi:hypothetical protein